MEKLHQVDEESHQRARQHILNRLAALHRWISSTKEEARRLGCSEEDIEAASHPCQVTAPVSVLHCDHLVLTVRDLRKALCFYGDVLGMTVQRFGEHRWALVYGTGKINLHEADQAPILPRAQTPTPGSADLCFLVDQPVEKVALALQSQGIAVEVGPVNRQGARQSLRSIYVRDPDGNLIELANEVNC